MQRIFYPCEISQDEEGYQVQFTDFPEGFTDGDSLEEAISNARDLLGALLFSYLKHGKDLPSATVPEDSSKNVYFIEAWPDLIKDKVSNQAVKKTLTIPKWLNDIAEERNVNFSAVLQRGIKEYCGL